MLTNKRHFQIIRTHEPVCELLHEIISWKSETLMAMGTRTQRQSKLVAKAVISLTDWKRFADRGGFRCNKRRAIGGADSTTASLVFTVTIAFLLIAFGWLAAAPSVPRGARTVTTKAVFYSPTGGAHMTSAHLWRAGESLLRRDGAASCFFACAGVL